VLIGLRTCWSDRERAGSASRKCWSGSRTCWSGSQTCYVRFELNCDGH